MCVCVLNLTNSAGSIYKYTRNIYMRVCANWRNGPAYVRTDPCVYWRNAVQQREGMGAERTFAMEICGVGRMRLRPGPGAGGSVEVV